MYIAPNTNIKFLRGVPLDPAHNHCIYFENRTALQTYMETKQKLPTLTSQSYQRVEKGVMRVQVAAENLYDCNYLMFQNQSFGAKWFYAFITAVEYVNNVTSEVRFTIDPVTTYWGDWYVEDAFVEREHPSTDVIGEHLEPEPVALGEYVFNNYNRYPGISTTVTLIAIVDVEGGSDGNIYDNVYGGATLWGYPSSDIDSINAKINQYKEKPDAVLAMYTCPAFMLPQVTTGGVKIQNWTSAEPTVQSYDPPTESDTLDGYSPKNNKMYTYPYNFLHVDNGQGSELNLRYEFFQNLTPRLGVVGTFNMPVQIVLRPKYYKGLGNVSLNTEMLKINSYPMCSWNTDAFEAWVAQNSIPLGLDIGSKIAGGLISNPTPLGLLTSGLSAITSATSQSYKASIAADIQKGSLSNGNVAVSRDFNTFFVGRCSVNYNSAQVIDSFFTAYGYAVNRVKQVDYHGRPEFNYVKTVDISVLGELPADDVQAIEDIFNRGVTFWKNPEHVGDYSVDNSV